MIRLGREQPADLGAGPATQKSAPEQQACWAAAIGGLADRWGTTTYRRSLLTR
jgi:hypothetical protein